MFKQTLGALRAGFLICALALLAAPTAALADGGGPSFTIGPIKVKHGWTVTISTACSPSGASTSIDYTKGSVSALLDHVYTGPKPTCSLAKSLGAGSLSLSWPSVATIDVKLGRPGRVNHPVEPRGCTVRGVERTVAVTGRISLSIHSGVFGGVSLRRATGFAERTTGVRCRSERSSIVMSATFGSGFALSMSGMQAPSGPRIVSIGDNQGDSPATGVSGFTEVQLTGGRSLFNAAANLSTAAIHARGIVSGSMRFKAQPACSGGKNSRPGTLTGQLVVHDPIVGTLRLGSAQATQIYIVKGTALPPTCGSDATPPTVALSDNCSAQGTCSVSAGTNTVYFGDGTLAGSAPITGETWNFGDGSAPISTGYPGLNVQHTYAAPGAYAVTLTVTAGGSQYTGTGTVYIGS